AELRGLAGNVKRNEARQQDGCYPPGAPADRVRRGRGVRTLQEVGGRGGGKLLCEEGERPAGEELNLDAFEALPRRLHRCGMTVPLRGAGVEDETPASRRAGLDAGEGDLERLSQGIRWQC